MNDLLWELARNKRDEFNEALEREQLDQPPSASTAQLARWAVAALAVSVLALIVMYVVI